MSESLHHRAWSLEKLMVLFTCANTLLLAILVNAGIVHREREFKAFVELCDDPGTWQRKSPSEKAALLFPIRMYDRDSRDRACLDERLRDLKAQMQIRVQPAPGERPN
jgi:hypothetical protein